MGYQRITRVVLRSAQRSHTYRTRFIIGRLRRYPEPIPRDTDYSSLIESDVPVVVQHTRLDSRQAENALMSTIAYPGND